MRQRSRRERFDGDPGRNKRPGISEAKGAGIETSTSGVKKTVVGFEDVVAGGPAEQSEIEGDDAPLSGVPGVKGLGHRAEILAKAGSLAGGDTQGAGADIPVGGVQFHGRSSSSERAAGSRGVESVLVMAGEDGLRDFGFDLDADMVSQQEIASGSLAFFGDGQGRRQARGRGMSQQAVNAVFSHSQLRIVIVVGVDA